MSRILRRPMFRGGRPNPYGTGITANLEKRKNYNEGSLDPARTAFAKQVGQAVQQQATPAYGEQVRDFLRAFGASAAPAGQFQTLGGALGKTSANFQNIFGPKLQKARDLGQQTFLKTLSGTSDQKLLKYQKLAKDLWAIESQKPEDQRQFQSYDETFEYVIRTTELEGVDKSDALRTKTIEDITKRIQTDTSLNYADAKALAETQYKIANDADFRRKVGGRLKGLIPRNFEIDTTTGNYVWTAPDRNPPSTLQPNNVYLDPVTRNLYYFDGQKSLILLK